MLQGIPLTFSGPANQYIDIGFAIRTYTYIVPPIYEIMLLYKISSRLLCLRTEILLKLSPIVRKHDYYILIMLV